MTLSALAWKKCCSASPAFGIIRDEHVQTHQHCSRDVRGP